MFGGPADHVESCLSGLLSNHLVGLESHVYFKDEVDQMCFDKLYVSSTQQVLLLHNIYNIDQPS